MKRLLYLIIPAFVATIAASVDYGRQDGKDLAFVEAALFGKFETIFYSKTELLFSRLENNGIANRDVDALRIPFADLQAVLDSLGKNTSTELFGAADAVLVGAKDFRPPKNLGDVQSRFCFVLILKTRSPVEIAGSFSRASKTSVLEKPAWTWVVGPTEGRTEPTHVYAVPLGESYILISNDLDDLGNIIQTVSSRSNDQTLVHLRDWNLVRDQQYWGYRRYGHQVITNRVAAGLSEIANDAQALIYLVDVKAKISTVRLLTTANGARTAGNLNARAALPPFRPIRADVWETTIPLAGDESTQERIMEVMGLFGFGLYL